MLALSRLDLRRQSFPVLRRERAHGEDDDVPQEKPAGFTFVLPSAFRWFTPFGGHRRESMAREGNDVGGTTSGDMNRHADSHPAHADERERERRSERKSGAQRAWGAPSVESGTATAPGRGRSDERERRKRTCLREARRARLL